MFAAKCKQLGWSKANNEGKKKDWYQGNRKLSMPAPKTECYFLFSGDGLENIKYGEQFLPTFKNQPHG